MPSLHRTLRRIRPSSLAVLLKKILGVKRRVAKTTFGDTLWIDPVSEFGGDVLDDGVYEIELTHLLGLLLRPGDCFVDVGANEGYFSVVASRLVGKGKVLCVEPQTRLQPIIQENLNLNACRNVTVLPLALAQSEGKTTLHLTPDTNTGSTNQFKKSRFGGAEETVLSQTLDSVLRAHGIERVRFLKLDCEGAELPIVLGAGELLARRAADYIFCEFHPHIVGEEPAIQIDGLLREAGYRLSHLNDGHWIYRLPGLDALWASLGPTREIGPGASGFNPVG